MVPQIRPTLTMQAWMIWAAAVTIVIHCRMTAAEQCSTDLPSCDCEPGLMICQGLHTFPTKYPEHVTEFIFQNCTFENVSDIPYVDATRLLIQDTPVKNISEDAFTNMRKLTYLRIADGLLAAISPKHFNGLTALTELELQANRLSSLPPGVFAEMPNLQTIHLSGNPFISVHGDAFKGVSPTNLTCAQCNLQSIPPAVLNMTSLVTLDLSHNQFRTIADNTFSSLTNLQFLNLESCQITNLEPGSLAGLKQLVKLYLEDNQLMALDSQVFSDFRSTIKTVRLNKNQLSTLPEDLFPGERFGDITLYLGENPWSCDCNLVWILPVHMQNENATCAEPTDREGQNIFAAAKEISDDCAKEEVNKANLAWIIGIPIVTVVLIFVAYFVIKRHRKTKKQAELRKKGLYSGVYQDPVETPRPPLQEL